MTSGPPITERIHRPPVRFRRGFRDRHGPLPHHVPAGPPVLALVGPDELLASAESRARADAAAAVHDPVSLGHEAKLLFERENDEQRTRDESLLAQLEVGDLALLDAIKAGAVVEAAEADAELTTIDEEAAELAATVTDCQDELRGRAPYEDSVWKAPERVSEPTWQTMLKRWVVLAVLVPAELGINFLALQLLPGDGVERFSFALVVGLAAVWAGHAAGCWLAEHRRAALRARVAVPAALAVLVVAVTALMAALRVAFVNRSPGPDPSTGEPMPSALTTSGIPPGVVWAGIAAVQLLFFAVTVLHVLATHNPRVRALQTATARHRRLRKRRAAATRRQVQAQQRQHKADADVGRTARAWADERTKRAALYAQRFARYTGELARALGDPDATVALEARHARADATPRTARPPVRPAASTLTIVPTDSDSEPPDDDPTTTPVRGA